MPSTHMFLVFVRAHNIVLQKLSFLAQIIPVTSQIVNYFKRNTVCGYIDRVFEILLTRKKIT